MARLSDFNFQNNNKQTQSQKKQEKVTKENLQDTFNKYKNYSQSDLFSTLMSQVEKQKQEGTFDYNQLESMVESFKGSLPDESYKQIKRILERLK